MQLYELLLKQNNHNSILELLMLQQAQNFAVPKLLVFYYVMPTEMKKKLFPNFKLYLKRFSRLRVKISSRFKNTKIQIKVANFLTVTALLVQENE